jgi:hypothetical protein
MAQLSGIVQVFLPKEVDFAQKKRRLRKIKALTQLKTGAATGKKV